MGESKRISVLDIEKKYPVEKIKVNGILFWPYIRNYIGSQIHFNVDRQVTVSSKNLPTLLKSLFYGFMNILKPAKTVFMSSSCQRRNIDGKFVDRMDFFKSHKYFNKSILIEQPNPSHFSKNRIPNQHIISKIPFYLIELILSFFIKIRIEEEALLKNILKEYNLNIDYKKNAEKFIAQYKLFKYFFKIKKTEYLFYTVQSANASRIKAANDLGVKTIELQHGIINKNHYTYNVVKNIDATFYPNYLLSFGEKEIEIFDSKNFFVKKENVLPLGSFYIDYLQKKKFEINKEIKVLKNEYSSVVGLSCQDAFDELWIPFIKEFASIAPKVCIILMLRSRNKEYYDKFNFSENIRFIDNLNTYQLIQQVDIHLTINSTTAIEALSLGKPNILLNINNFAKDYMVDLLPDNKFTFYVNTPEELQQKINHLSKFEEKNIIDSNFSNIVSNFSLRLPEIIKTIEKD